ncbi:MAG TPA: AAA family ATPase [Candidatus Alectryocaccomicrobium excrementavium]|uniref:AAA family ATPase n=1 Tax=Candidatus Alectryocaccomicrobium excrementavium TaxID=2840668 RepID=A0A9D1G0S7_9FIRM|nr:AAA family ATPase [Candidatus Alectryocaccomicrobium excrementavium]
MIFLRSLSLGLRGETGYPFLPRLRNLGEMAFAAPVTVFVGENGSGKSTLLEAMACALRLPAIGADDTAYDATLASVRPLANALRFTFSRKARHGFFLRAEDFFGFTRRISQMQRDMRAELARVDEEYRDHSAFTRGQARMAFASSLAELNARYGVDPDARSHGESFLSLFSSRIHPGGLYLLDEPESPLSPTSQLALLAMLMDRESDCQFILATHSPILMAYPGAQIWSFDASPPQIVPYKDLENIQLMRDFLNQPDRYIAQLRKSE